MTMLSDSRILVAGGTVTSPMPKGVPRHETIAKDRPAPGWVWEPIPTSCLQQMHRATLLYRGVIELTTPARELPPPAFRPARSHKRSSVSSRSRHSVNADYPPACFCANLPTRKTFAEMSASGAAARLRRTPMLISARN
jgi:hypothetical protein